jgi:hypothetical protein
MDGAVETLRISPHLVAPRLLRSLLPVLVVETLTFNHSMIKTAVVTTPRARPACRHAAHARTVRRA